MFGASRGLFPHRLSDDEEGERRVFHVALTRARRQVAVLADADAPSVFVAELDGRRPRPAPGGPTGPTGPTGRAASRGERGRRAAGTTPTRPVGPPPVEAVAGLVVEHGGQQGPLVDVTGTGAVHQVGRARVALAYGTEVTVDGRLATLVAPGTGPSPGTAAAEQALRTWRSSVARAEGVPAYVVLNDAELAGIAARRPATLAELARCRGVGPIRLERWGDEILAVLASADPVDG